MAAARVRPTRPRRGRRGRHRLEPRRAPRTLASSIDPISRTPMVGRFSPPAATDSPRVMPETRCASKNWEWWPGAESNHRHADFQYDVEPSSASLSRRTGTRFPLGDRTALPDRAYPEPEPLRRGSRARSSMPLNGLRASRPNLFRTEAARADGVSTSIDRDRQMRTQVLFGIVRSLMESRTKALTPSSIARVVPLLLSDRAALRRKTLRAPVRRHASDFQRAPERWRIAERGRVPLPAHDLLDR